MPPAGSKSSKSSRTALQQQQQQDDTDFTLSITQEQDSQANNNDEYNEHAWGAGYDEQYAAQDYDHQNVYDEKPQDDWYQDGGYAYDQGNQQQPEGSNDG